MKLIQASLLNKLLATVLFSSLLVFVAALYFYSVTSKAITSYEDLLTVDIANERATANIQSEFKTQVQEWKNVLLRGHEMSNRNKYWGRFIKQEKTIQEQIAALVAGQQGAGIEKVKKFHRAHIDMGKAYRQGYSAFVAADADHKSGDRAVKGIDREPSKLLAEAAEIMSANALGRSESINQTVEKATFLSAALLLSALIASLILTSWLANLSIVQPMKKLIHNVSALSKGQLFEPKPTNRMDELATLANATEELQSFIRDVAGQMQHNTSNLNSTTEALVAVSESVASASHSASDRAQQISVATEEMSASINEVSTLATEAADSARVNSDSVESANLSMNDANSAIARLNQQISDSTQKIQQLADRASNAGQVLNVIRGIAEQTNLLALNAAIEAARAGEQGRGFAVVADEVRSLAQRTQDSTKEIEDILQDLQERSSQTASLISSSKQNTEECTTLFNSASEQLTTIKGNISQLDHINTQMANAANEQATVATEIAQTTSEVAGSSEQTAEAGRNILDQINTLTEVVDNSVTVSAKFRFS